MASNRITFPLSFVLLFLLVCPSIIQAGNHHFLVEVSPGFGAGWWVYNKGTTTGEAKNNLGWDHTHLSAMVNFNGSVFYQVKQWKVGVGGGYSMFFDEVMLTSGNRIYDIADKYVKFAHYYGQAEYALFSKRKFSLSPFVKLGSFQIYTTHPEKGNFGRKFFWEAGFTNQIELNKGFYFIVQPKYLNMTIFPEEEKADKERHGIYSFGMNVGVRYLLK